MPASKTCFISDRTDGETRKYFEGRRQGFLKKEEKIGVIEKRYAPVGIFKVSWSEDEESGVISKIKKTSEKQNTFYVNLNDATLYFLRKPFLSKYEIGESDFLGKIVDLPNTAVEFLSDILKKGRITHRDLDKKHFLFLDGNPDFLLMLKTRELIDFNRRYRTQEYLAKTSSPSFDRKKYDLSNYLSTENRSLDEKAVDGITHDPQKILDKLKKVLQGEGSYEGTIYLPYNRCKYVDGSGRFRFEKLISPKLKSTG